MKLRLGILAALACMLVLTAACGGDDESGSPAVTGPIPEDAKLVAAAKKEGSLTWYSAFPPEANQATVDAFEKRYPDISVKALRLTSGQIGTRYAGERSSDAKTADLVSLSDSTFYEEADKHDWFEKKLDLAALDKWPQGRYYKRGRATVGLLPLQLAHNTQKVPEGEVPKQWADLAAPKWKGQLIYGDPRSVPAYLALAELWRQEYGEDFLRQFAALKPKLVESVVPGGQQLAAGGASLMVPSNNTTLSPLIKEGAPIKVTPMAPPTTGIEFVAAVSTHTPHPNAARLFMNFLLTKPGQALINGGGGTSVLGKVSNDSVTLPEGYKPVDPLLEDARKHEKLLLSLLGIEG
jgi:iron(III) transport system substrate-binding protein